MPRYIPVPFTKTPPSRRIARDLNKRGANQCKHGAVCCWRRCGVILISEAELEHGDANGWGVPAGWYALPKSWRDDQRKAAMQYPRKRTRHWHRSVARRAGFKWKLKLMKNPWLGIAMAAMAGMRLLTSLT